MKQPRDMTEKQFEAAVARGGFKPVGSEVQGAWWLLADAVEELVSNGVDVDSIAEESHRLAEEFTKGASE